MCLIFRASCHSRASRVWREHSATDVRRAVTVREDSRVIGDTAVRVERRPTEIAERFRTAPSPVDPQLLAATTALTRKMWGNIPVIPTMGTGATDGRLLQAVGIPTYGVSGIFSVPGETNSHGRDEKLRVKSFYEGLDFLDQLVRQVATAPRT